MPSASAPVQISSAVPSSETLDRILETNWWYHQMQLTEARVTPGRYGDNLIPVAYLLKHVALQGMTCLDVGAMDGKMSFLMERLGGRALAVDGVGKATVPALIDAYGSSVRYRTGIILERLGELAASEGLFDFVLCSGVAYHVYSPFDLIANVRTLLRTGGMAIFETAALPDDTGLQMSLNRGQHYQEHTTLWIPTTACFRYMLRFFAMRVLGESQLRTNDYHVVRHAWLVQADTPSTLARETGDPWLQTLLGGAAPGWSHEYLKPQLDLAAMETRDRSTISASPVPDAPIFRIEDPDGYANERALLATGTPAWRALYS